jgi:hypothetical protein
MLSTGFETDSRMRTDNCGHKNSISSDNIYGSHEGC